jgi:N-carbamoylputrescine amidase
MRTLVLAAVQMESDNHRVTENLARAERLVAEAARGQAELVLLPELFSTGYEVNAGAWQFAEPQGGVTEDWLGATARRHGLHVGGSYLERRGSGFFNTFALAGPSGQIVGRVRKSHPCAIEAYVFEGADDPRVIDTAIGRIGVAICYDAFFRSVWDDILAGSPDIVLMPMSAPTPSQTLFYGKRRIDSFHASFSRLAIERALSLGIPMAIANKCGPWQTTPPGWFPRLLWRQMKSAFPGFSHVADSDGREAARVPTGQGIALARVQLDPARKRSAVAAEQDRFKPWMSQLPSEYDYFRYFEALGRRWYGKHAGLQSTTLRPLAAP